MSDMEQAVKSMYWSTAGEIEARDSANRRSMTAEERKNSPPDTGDELTVFADGAGEAKQIVELPNGWKYVKADRQVILGNDPVEWGYQIENYINKKIRDGEDVVLTTDSGDVLLITKDTQGKASFRNYRRDKNGVFRRYTDEEYLAKLNAEAHIDELARISKKTGNASADEGDVHGDLAAGGWEYRTAYFLDYDGQYYRVTISTPINSEGEKIVYNVGRMKKEEIPSFRGSMSLSTTAQVGNSSSAQIVSEEKPDVNSKSQINVDTDTETAVSAEEIERNQNTQEPLQDTGITDNRFTEALKKIGVNNITGSLVDYAGIEVEQQTARTAAEARRYLRRVLRETRADPRTQAFAHDVARGIYTMDDLPNTMSRGIVEELADAYRFAEGVVQDSLAYKRRQINAGLDADARKLFADSDNYNPAKFGRLSKTLMNERTPAR